MRNLNVIHRDLKLGNLFLTNKMELRVGDFGLAAQVSKKKPRRTSICGTPNYVAPEVLNQIDGHSFEADIWALGVIVYTLLVGRAPFETRTLSDTYRKIQNGNYCFPKHVSLSKASKKFVNDLLQTDPNKRLKLDNIMKHDFFKSEYPELMPVSTLT